VTGRRALAAGLLAVIAVLVPAASARPAGGPFYLVPSATKQCQNVKKCIAVTGPWVIVPAHEEATFLFGCPTTRGFDVTGSDARASSSDVRVWYDGLLGAPVGTPADPKNPGVGLLFHAVTNSGRVGSFQPVIGCVPLSQKKKRSTLSAIPGSPAAPSPTYRAETLIIFPSPAHLVPSSPLSCKRGEALVGSWDAVAYNALGGPPDLAYANAVTVKALQLGDTVQATVRTLKELPEQAQVQIGAICVK
jgi:hypothetical protein